MDALEALLARQSGCLILTGHHGTGKSTLFAAAVAQCDATHLPVQVLSDEKGVEEYLSRSSQNTDAICAVEIPNSLSRGLRRSLLERLQDGRRCSIITATTLSAAERLTLSSGGSAVYALPAPEEDRAQTLAVAEAMWHQDAGSQQPLHVAFSPEALDGLAQGPWPNGFHSMRSHFARLCDALVLRGELVDGELLAPVGTADVNAAVLDVIRAEEPMAAPKERGLYIVVEGDTDVGYLRRAGELANKEWHSNLLQDCVVEPGGAGRGGGGTAALRKLAMLSWHHDAIGLFDADTPGKGAKKRAAELNLRAECLPDRFDRLARKEGAEVEIEDLLPLALIDAFYAEHPDCEPEELRERGDLRRVVPKGEHKDRLMLYACEAAGFKDAERLAYVLCSLWDALGLPLPAGPASDMKSWLQAILNG